MDTRRRTVASGGLSLITGTLESATWLIILPTVARDFQTTGAVVTWLLVAYALGIAGSSLVVGRVGEVMGYKRLALVGFLTEAAILAAMVASPVLWPLFILRFFQGVAKTTGVTSTFALLVGAYPPEQRGSAVGLRYAFSYVGLLVGPLYAGLVTDAAGWRPALLGAFALYLLSSALVLLFARADRPGEAGGLRTLRRLDWPGAFVFLLAIGALVYSFQLLRQGSPVLAALCVVVALLLLAGTVRLERRSASPALNLGLFKVPAFSAAAACLLVVSVCFGAAGVLFPFFMQEGLQWSVALSGAAFIAINVMQVWGAPVMGRLSDKVGALRLVVAGVAVFVMGLVLGAGLGPGAAVWQVVGVMLVIGTGMAVFESPNNSVLFRAAPASLGSASAVSGTFRFIGQSMGGAIGGALLAAHTETGIAAGFAASMLVLAAVLAAGVSAVLGALALAGRRAPQADARPRPREAPRA